MSDVKEVRAALERLAQEPTPDDAALKDGGRLAIMVAQAFVTEGLKVCDEHEVDEVKAGGNAEPPQKRVTISWTQHTRMGFIQGVLKRAGVMR